MQTWVHDNPGTVSPADAQLALHALDRVVASTAELHELWVEDADGARAVVSAGTVLAALSRRART